MKIIVPTSSFPISDNDEVPAFVKDQIIALKNLDNSIEFIAHAPHNFYSRTVENLSRNENYSESRFHYFLPYRFELLAGRGIMPALRQNKLLYLQIPFFMFFSFTSLLVLTIRKKPDLIYAHWFMPQAISAALVSFITRTPFGFTTHASDVSVLKKLPLAGILVRFVCRRAKFYTAVSNRTAGKLQDMFNEDEWNKVYSKKLSTIPMGVPTNTVQKYDSIIKNLRAEYNISPDKKIVLFIGRLAEKKGVSYLINALSLLDKHTLNKLHVIIAGDGQLRDDLEGLTTDLALTNVTFVGYVSGDTKNALFSMADITCFPSIIDSMNDSEGFPVSVMESMAAGKIVAASNVTGAEDIISDGIDGYIFEQKSAKAVAEKLKTISDLSSVQIKDIERKSKKMSDKFSWPVIADQHMKEFSKALY
jgi:glycosyltransferase involved in cell wall biosynthesis